ncbi:MAG: glycosyltransferase family 39 protein [Gemmatimonadota bacterium]|nr:glycosyltransferase family 39 protein [Gemmatimonadota bacterium]MDP6801834.1 glycosyltransferase family 39 protein [Gemmatimonadota bacterium]MDP7031560.1 glycosyltransferase family 39 protein [Gemmatimonadota bacterium]
MRRRIRHARELLLVLGVAVVARLLFRMETGGDSLFSLLAIDERLYFRLGQQFASGDYGFGAEPLWFAPLYPTLLGLIFAVAGPSAEVIRWVQTLLGCGTAVLVASLAGRVASRRAALMAGLALAVLPAALFFEGRLLYTSITLFGTALFLRLLVEAWEEPRGALRYSVWAGLALGLLGLARSNVLLFAPVGALLLLWRRGWRSGVLFGAGVCVMLLPVLLRNGVTSGEWTPMTVNGGMILATSFEEGSVGGRAGLRGPTDFGPGGSYQREAEQALGRRVSLAEASRYHRDLAVSRVRNDPAGAARLVVRKVALLFNAREIGDNLDLEFMRERSVVLRWIPAPWAIGMAAALAGAVVAVRRRKESHLLLLAFALVYAISLLVFFVNSRYRLPLAVPGAVLGAVGVCRILDLARLRKWRPLALPALVVSVVLAAGLRDPGVRADPALRLLAVGAALEGAGDHEEALAMTDAAIEQAPEIPGAYQNRAVSLLALGRRREALAAATEALRRNPALFDAWMTRGAILAGEGLLEEAAVAFERAVQLSPDDPGARRNLRRAREMLEAGPERTAQE